MEQFFYFDSLQFGIHLGYDLESNYTDFVKEHKKEYEASCRIEYKGKEISEWDIASVFIGELTEPMKDFIVHIKALSEDSPDTNDVLMVTNHSGGSDYLTEQKVREYKI